MDVILSPFVLGPATAAISLAAAQHLLAAVAFVVFGGLVVGATSAAKEARRARLRWHALQHRLPYDSGLA